MKIYMKVTKDKYELPLCVADSVSELSLMCGTSTAVILSAISHGYKGWARVEVDDHE